MEEDEEDEDEDTSSEDVSEAEVEEPRAKRKKTKSTGKANTTRTKAATRHDNAHDSLLPIRAKKGRKVAMADANVEGLYGLSLSSHLVEYRFNTNVADVFTSGKSAEKVTESWLEKVEEDAPAALTDLINLIIRCTGSPSQVTVDDISDPENITNRVQELQDEYQEVRVLGFEDHLLT